MRKRIIISEDEKREIRGMYNLDEAFGEKLLNKLKDKGIDIANKLVKKYTGKELKDITVDDLNSIGLQSQEDLNKEIEHITHSIKNGDVVTILQGPNPNQKFRVVYVEGNTITVDLGHGDTMDYKVENVRLEPEGSKPSYTAPDYSADKGMEEFINSREWNGSEWVPKKSSSV